MSEQTVVCQDELQNQINIARSSEVKSPQRFQDQSLKSSLNEPPKLMIEAKTQDRELLQQCSRQGGGLDGLQNLFELSDSPFLVFFLLFLDEQTALGKSGRGPSLACFLPQPTLVEKHTLL